MPGTHDSMVLEPNVRVMAARLRACMEKVEASLALNPRSALAALRTEERIAQAA
jgi:hypothetical protein